MPTLINDPSLEEELIAERREKGLDKYDEVWDGMYVMAPLADIEHQALLSRLTMILGILIQLPGLGEVYAGGNVSDRDDDWTKNYRVPDVLVFLNGNRAEKRVTHWYGGPDLAVEVASVHDRSRAKIDFYSGVGVGELLIIDRDPWQLELFRAVGGQLKSVGLATESNELVINSNVVPISMKLTAAEVRPGIVVSSNDGQSWTI